MSDVYSSRVAEVMVASAEGRVIDFPNDSAFVALDHDDPPAAIRQAFDDGAPMVVVVGRGEEILVIDRPEGPFATITRDGHPAIAFEDLVLPLRPGWRVRVALAGGRASAIPA